MTSPTKILFLVLDAADRALIKKWAAEGVLPTFRRLLAQGLVGDTMSVRGFYVGATWPSLYTAVTPAKHGVHTRFRLRQGSYEFERSFVGDTIQREPYWAVLSRAGRRVAIFDVPLSGISEGLNGLQTVEWGFHDADYGFRAWPPTLKNEIESRFGTPSFMDICNADNRTPQEFVEFKDQLIDQITRKTELTKYYLQQGGWDFFTQVFTESHCVGHQCWHLHDAAHPGHVPDIVKVTGDPMRDVYVAIDHAIGEIIELLGDDALLVVAAAHGMAHKFGATFLLPEILVRLGVAEAHSQDGEVGGLHGPIRRLDDALTWGWQQIPNGVQRHLQRVRHQLRGWIDSQAEPTLPPLLRLIDVRRSRCFLLYHDFPSAGIRVNLAGREPEGLVQPGEEMDAFCAQLAEDLMSIVDADTGRPMVREVVRTSDLYQGEFLHHLPDLLVEWSDDVLLDSATAGYPGGGKVRLSSDKIGVVEGVNDYCRTGEHRPKGLFTALAPGLKPGHLGRTVSIMDFAPTFAKVLGVDLPDVDGRPIPEIVDALAAQGSTGVHADLESTVQSELPGRA